MTADKRPLKVFLCHARADTLTGTGRDRVHALYTRLTQDGVDAWLDKEKLLPGQDWELEIRKAVREADVVVVCLSKQFNQAGFRQKEVRLALDTAMEQPEGEIFIIPARLEECDNLESLRRWHWVDLFEEGGYEMLMRALRARANKIGATLQVKKGWLPNITTPRKSEKKVVEENTVNPNVDLREMPAGEKPQQKQNKTLPKRKLNFRRLVGNSASIFMAVLVALTIIFSMYDFIVKRLEATNKPEINPTNTMHAVSSLSSTPAVIFTETTFIIPTKNATLTPTPLPTEITDDFGVEMVLVPAGEFTMGSDDDQSVDNPVHTVYLDDFYIDRYEVTNKLYKACVDTGKCKPPRNSRSNTHNEYYGNPEFDKHPVVWVEWDMAKTYCEWRGANLPTEAQWEKAARGIDGRMFPWGDDVDCSKANYYDTDQAKYCVGDTTKVGSYESGISPFGLYDMSGNVWEWVDDWYNVYPNGDTNASKYFGQKVRIIRGGSWRNLGDPEYILTFYRGYEPVYVLSYDNVGFRCAKDASP